MFVSVQLDLLAFGANGYSLCLSPDRFLAPSIPFCKPFSPLFSTVFDDKEQIHNDDRMDDEKQMA
jgi:hypothetical protein